MALVSKGSVSPAPGPSPLAHRVATASQRLSVVITQKLGSSAIPILGALSGGALNYAFISYYEEMAHIRFRLKQLDVEYSDVNPMNDFVRKLK